MTTFPSRNPTPSAKQYAMTRNADLTAAAEAAAHAPAPTSSATTAIASAFQPVTARNAETMAVVANAGSALAISRSATMGFATVSRIASTRLAATTAVVVHAGIARRVRYVEITSTASAILCVILHSNADLMTAAVHAAHVFPATSVILPSSTGAWLRKTPACPIATARHADRMDAAAIAATAKTALPAMAMASATMRLAFLPALRIRSVDRTAVAVAAAHATPRICVSSMVSVTLTEPSATPPV